VTNRFARAFRGCLAVVAACFAVLVAGEARGANAVRISQVYGGGGNGGAVYQNDFVELFNASNAPVSIGGWSLSYASATGTFNGTLVLPAGATIAPNGYYLIQLASAGAVGVALPTPDATGTLGLSATVGNVVLTTGAVANATACASLAGIVDKVGFGTTAACFEGGAATPAPSVTTAVLRKSAGLIDTDVNSADFYTAAPSPRNSASTLAFAARSGSSPSGDGWTIAASTANTAQAGSFTGSSADNGATPPSGAGAGTTAWGLYANSSQNVTATLPVTPSMGQTVAIDFDNGQVDNGSAVGVELRSSTGAAVTFGFTGGDSFYKVTDGAGSTTTSVGYTNSGVRVSFTIGQNGGYKVVVGSYSKTGLLAGGATSVASIRVFNTNAGSNANRNLYFNNLAISAVASVDLDGDGYNAGSGAGLDCNDNNAAIKPGAVELCSTVGIDNNCDGSTSDVDANASDKVLFFRRARTSARERQTGAIARRSRRRSTVMTPAPRSTRVRPSCARPRPLTTTAMVRPVMWTPTRRTKCFSTAIKTVTPTRFRRVRISVRAQPTRATAPRPRRRSTATTQTRRSILVRPKPATPSMMTATARPTKV
jgi:hypothetical protein